MLLLTAHPAASELYKSCGHAGFRTTASGVWNTTCYIQSEVCQIPRMQIPAVIGIDIGGSKLLFILFDESFTSIERIKLKTPKAGKTEFAAIVAQAVKKLCRIASKRGYAVKCIGVGSAGDVNIRTGVVQSSANIPALHKFSFKRTLSESCRKVHTINDVDAALYGELKFGAASGYKHVIAVFIGTGIGGAIAIDGRLYVGMSGAAGDIGHYLLQPFGPLAGSERQGVLDGVASRVAIAGEAAALAAKHWAPNLLELAGTDVHNIRSGSLAKAISAGDKVIEELVRGRMHTVGIVLSNFVDFLNPELVLLGGGLTDALPELVRGEIATAIHSHSTANARHHLEVVTAALEERAVATGAAKLAWDLEHNAVLTDEPEANREKPKGKTRKAA
jgi:glucokinase